MRRYLPLLNTNTYYYYFTILFEKCASCGEKAVCQFSNRSDFAVFRNLSTCMENEHKLQEAHVFPDGRADSISACHTEDWGFNSPPGQAGITTLNYNELLFQSNVPNTDNDR